MGGIAAMVLMTIMYSARVARYDLLKPVAFLAKRITRWDALCDKRLHRLICYIQKTKDDCMMGWIGDDPKDLTGRLFVDADFVGCPYTLKSTNGCHFDIEGPNSRFPISAGCNGQTSTAQSSTEAEISSLNAGMKNRADPAITVLRMILGQYHTQPGGGTPAAQSDGLSEPRGRMGLPSSTGRLSDGTYGAGGK